MSPLPPAKAERAALCDLMSELGADAPTLCEGWTNYDMAAHLFVREHRPIASIGIVVPKATGIHDNAILRAKDRMTFDQLVTRVAAGPSLLWKPIDAVANVQEYFVHHEDVRRGAGDTTPRPAQDVAELEALLWKNLKRGHKLMTRNIKGVAVTLAAPDEEPIHAGKGEETVTISGRPGEIVLYLLGRRDAAQVEVTGSEAARAALARANLGI